MNPTLEHQLEHRRMTDLIGSITDVSDAKALALVLLASNTELKGVVNHMIFQNMRELTSAPV